MRRKKLVNIHKHLFAVGHWAWRVETSESGEAALSTALCPATATRLDMLICADVTNYKNKAIIGLAAFISKGYSIKIC